MFDFHIHLARLPHQKQLAQLLYDRNYDFIAVACEPWEWNTVSSLKKEFSTVIKPFKASYGLHPMIAPQTTDEMLNKLRRYLADDEMAMVGEAGIDKRYPGYDDGTQDRVFMEQAKMAIELKRDIQIHCVGDYQRVLRILVEAGLKADDNTPRPIFHRFGGDLNFVKKALPYGSLFSLHMDSFNKKSTAQAISHIPGNRVFFETDADETFLNVVDASSQRQTFIAGLNDDQQVPSEIERDNENASPARFLEELEKRLESVRLAYTQCCE